MQLWLSFLKPCLLIFFFKKNIFFHVFKSLSFCEMLRILGPYTGNTADCSGSGILTLYTNLCEFTVISQYLMIQNGTFLEWHSTQILGFAKYLMNLKAKNHPRIRQSCSSTKEKIESVFHTKLQFKLLLLLLHITC